MTDNSLGRYREGLEEFGSARRSAFFQEIIGHLRGKSTQLLSFDDIRARLHLREQTYGGIQEVPLDRIVGTVGRYHDFTRAFLPKREEMRQRWSHVYAQAISLEGLPPIELYKVCDVYFVRDGNHRVSVARRLKAKTIQAEVIELPTSICLKPGMSPGELDATTVYAEFVDKTHLQRTRPRLISLMLSEPSRYDDLLGHIDLHRCVEEDKETCSLSLADAAAHWYDSVYQPVAECIRKHDVLEYFPKRTEADLYLWLVDHLCECEAQCVDVVKPEPLQQFLVDFLKEREIPVPQV